MPHSLIDGGGGPANRLWIRLQPEERISVQLMAKTPGKGMQLEPVELDLNLAGPSAATSGAGTPTSACCWT